VIILSSVTFLLVIGFFLLVRHWTVGKNKEVEALQSAVRTLANQQEVAASRHKDTIALLGFVEKRLNRLQGYVEGFDPGKWQSEGMDDEIMSDEEFANHIVTLNTASPSGPSEVSGKVQRDQRTRNHSDG